MGTQLLIGSLVILGTVMIHAWAFSRASRWIDAAYGRVLRQFRRFGLTVLLIFGVLWVLLAITADVWLWASVLYRIDALRSIEESVYFALISFTTLGFGDIILETEWRILSGMIAANGLLMFGWSTAFMVEMVRKLRAGP